MWIWQQPGWPELTYRSDALTSRLGTVNRRQGALVGRYDAAGGDATLDTLLRNILASSAIEGETLNVRSVRSSLARRLNRESDGFVTPTSEGLAELMMDVTTNVQVPLTLERLFQWHRWLFAGHAPLLDDGVRIGGLRGDEPMQVVSGRVDRPVAHFEAPPRERLEAELAAFLKWFERSRHDPALDPTVRAGLAHLRFVTLHPFDDGNGRLARAVSDLALAQSDPLGARLYTMSAAIFDDRHGYYRALERAQRGGTDVTSWLEWFLDTLRDALERADRGIEQELSKARFWRRHADLGLSDEQRRFLRRVLDRGDFEDGFGARHYKSIVDVSKATATRHLADLKEKGVIESLPGGGRSTRYQVVMPGA